MAGLDIIPTRAGFLAFIRNIMGVPVDVLPDDSDYIDISFDVALAIVNRDICAVSPRMYTWAVYNLGGSTLLNIAQDLPDAEPYPGSELPYFRYFRAKFDTNGFVSGVISAAADESTSESMVVQEAAKNFTLANLQQLKDPYGRTYLGIAQDMGDLWGLS